MDKQKLASVRRMMEKALKEAMNDDIAYGEDKNMTQDDISEDLEDFEVENPMDDADEYDLDDYRSMEDDGFDDLDEIDDMEEDASDDLYEMDKMEEDESKKKDKGKVSIVGMRRKRSY